MNAVYTDDPQQVHGCADCLELIAQDLEDRNDYLGRCLHCRREITVTPPLSSMNQSTKLA